MFAVNVRGTFLCARAAAAAMGERGGSIVNVASETAVTGSHGFVHYVASKGAVISMTRALANELGPEGHPRELRGAGLHTDAGLGGARRVRRRAARRSAGSCAPTTCSARSATCCPTTRRSCRARRSSSTAGASRTDGRLSAATPRRHDATRARPTLVGARRRAPARAGRGGHRAHRGRRPAAQRGDPPPVRAGPARRRRSAPDGPFRGVPFLLKDFACAEAGEPHHQGMRALRDAGGGRARRQPARAARSGPPGSSRSGRTNMPELALMGTTEPDAYGPTHNPWDLEPFARRLVGRFGGRRRRRPRARRPRQRHRRLDPDPGRAVRAGRSQADARPGGHRPAVRPGGGHAHRGGDHPDDARHRRRCSTPSWTSRRPGRGRPRPARIARRRARPRPRPPARRPVRPGLQRRRGRRGLRDGSSRRRRGCSRSSATHVEEAGPPRCSTRPAAPAPGSLLACSAAAELDDWSARSADRSASTTWSRYVGARRGGPARQRCRRGAALERQQELTRQIGRGGAARSRRLRPAADADERRARPAPRRLQAGVQPRAGAARSPGRSTPRASRRCRCRSAGPTTACRVACSSSPPTGGRTCSCASARSSRRRRPGPTAAHHSAERIRRMYSSRSRPNSWNRAMRDRRNGVDARSGERREHRPRAARCAPRR